MRTLVLYLNELSCAFDGLSRDNIRAHVINTIATIRAIAKHREDTNLRMQCRLADLTLGADHSTLGAILGGGTAAHAGGAAVVVVVVVLIVIIVLLVVIIMLAVMRLSWPGFADADGEFLWCALKVHPFDGERASRSQGAIDAGQDVGGGIVNHYSALCRGRTFGEKIHWNGKVANLFHKAGAAEFVFGQTETLGLEVHLEASVLAEGCTDGDAEIGIERHRTRQGARRGKVAAEILWNEPADEHQVAVP